jgi:hypothetical protein
MLGSAAPMHGQAQLSRRAEASWLGKGRGATAEEHIGSVLLYDVLCAVLRAELTAAECDYATLRASFASSMAALQTEKERAIIQAETEKLALEQELRLRNAQRIAHRTRWRVSGTLIALGCSVLGLTVPIGVATIFWPRAWQMFGSFGYMFSGACFAFVTNLLALMPTDERAIRGIVAIAATVPCFLLPVFGALLRPQPPSPCALTSLLTQSCASAQSLASGSCST